MSDDSPDEPNASEAPTSGSGLIQPPEPGFKAKLRSAWQTLRERGRGFGQALNAKVLAPLGRKSDDWHLRDRLSKLVPNELAQSIPQKFDPVAMAEWAAKSLQKGGTAVYGLAGTLVAASYFLADLGSLLVENYIPDPPPAKATRLGGPQRKVRSLEDYAAIAGRNLFSSKGIIPGEEQPTQIQQPTDLGGAPVKTSLPISLIGTLILKNELRSIATIEDRTAQIHVPLRVQDELAAKLRVLAIYPRQMIFLNLSNSRREYVELPEEAVTNPKISVGGPKPGPAGPATSIEKVSSTQFNVPRAEVDRALADLNAVLTQARAVPNFENGLPAGYKLFQIVPGSIYDKLGLKNGDTLTGLNGAAINDPGKAFEMLAELKTSSRLELNVKRDGKASTFQYEIR